MRKDKSNKDMYTLVFVEQRGNPTKSSLKKRKVTLNRYIDLIMSINGYTEKNIIEDRSRGVIDPRYYVTIKFD